MKQTTFHISTKDNKKLFVRYWSLPPEEKLHSVVHIVHGMSDHSGRYAEFAEALVQAGFAVYAHDHRGHGHTATSEEERGFFAEENGWRLAVDDIYTVTELIRQEHPNVPIILFGHSMGSLLSRRYAQLYGKHIQGLILCAVGGDQGFLGVLAAEIAKLEMLFRGKRAKSKLMTKLVFNGYNREFEPIRTPVDWLSRDEQAVDRYIIDEMAGEVLCTSFFLDLITGVNVLHKKNNEMQIPKGLPLFMISGDKDPLGKQGRDVKKVFESYKQLGIRDVTCKLYPEARHELLNELNKHEVFHDIIEWMNAKISMGK